MTARGRVLVVLAFLVTASLFAGAAVAFVLASRDDNGTKPTTLPSIHPTLVFPSEQPTESPTQSPTQGPSAVPTATPAVTPTASPTTATPAATSSPTPRRTSSPRPSPTRTVVAAKGLSAAGTVTAVDAGAGKYLVRVRATDGSGTIYLKSIDWGDQTPSALNQRGTACSPPAKAPADCRTYEVTHTYADPNQDRIITVEVVSGTENAILHLTIDVTP